ncbi:MAG: protease complex subunit PrcB family protein [Blautia sp.]|nr:protease complex subunit PrcB family protein [Blautia sp.]
MGHIKKNRRWIAGILFVLLAFGVSGCVTQRSTEKTADLAYTVVKPADIPATLAGQIEEKKEEVFTLTYSDNQYLYIARGYGEQETGGYSIQVEECYLAEDSICVKTVLTGPQAGERVNTAPSYPYIVLKTELREEKVTVLLAYCQQFATLLY